MLLNFVLDCVLKLYDLAGCIWSSGCYNHSSSLVTVQRKTWLLELACLRLLACLLFNLFFYTQHEQDHDSKAILRNLVDTSCFNFLLGIKYKTIPVWYSFLFIGITSRTNFLPDMPSISHSLCTSEFLYTHIG